MMAHVDHNGDKFALVFPLIGVHFERAFLELPFLDKERERERKREREEGELSTSF
jgi:hypothetical protein